MKIRSHGIQKVFVPIVGNKVSPMKMKKEWLYIVITMSP